MNENDTNPPRRLRVFLRDHRVLDASARVPRGQYLSTYLASRTRYVNLTSVEWVGIGEEVGHMALKVDKILWAASEDGELALTSATAAATSRRVEVELEGGYLLSAGLLLIQNQRLSDYLQSAPPFVPLRGAELRPRGKKLGDVVVNQDAIQVVRELGPDEETRQVLKPRRGHREPGDASGQEAERDVAPAPEPGDAPDAPSEPAGSPTTER